MKISSNVILRLSPVAAVLCLLSTVGFAQSRPSSSSGPAPTPTSTDSYSAPSTRNRDSTAANTAGAMTSSDHLKRGDKHFVKKVAEGNQLEIALAQLAAERATDADVRSFAQQIATDHQQMCEKLDQLAQTKGLQSDVADYSVKMSHAGMTEMNTAHSTTTDSYSSTNAATAMNSTTNPSNHSLNTSDRSRAGTLAGGSREYDTTVATNDRSPANGSTTASPAKNHTAGADATATTTYHRDASDWNDPTKNRHYRHLAAKSGAEFDQEYMSMMVSDHEDDVAMFEKEAKKGGDADVRSFAESSLPKLQEHLSRAQQIAGKFKP